VSPLETVADMVAHLRELVTGRYAIAVGGSLGKGRDRHERYISGAINP
jgi:hypothetical protein